MCSLFLLITHLCVLSLTDNSCFENSKMAGMGCVDVLDHDCSSINEAMKPLDEDFSLTELIQDPVPPTVGEDNGNDIVLNGETQNQNIKLGRNIHTMSLEITEPDTDEEVTGEREGYMASVLARYKRTLKERTKYHLGSIYITIFDDLPCC